MSRQAALFSSLDTSGNYGLWVTDGTVAGTLSFATAHGRCR
jgi:ELWxxDGT repeat protein